MAGFIFKQILVRSLPFGKKKDFGERLKKVSGPIKIAGAIYVLFLVIMFWRGLDIATSFSDSSGVERASALIGSIFFVVSGKDRIWYDHIGDRVILLNKGYLNLWPILLKVAHHSE